MKKHKKINDEAGEQISTFERVYIIILILMALLALFLGGGNGEHWYPGQPFQER